MWGPGGSGFTPKGLSAFEYVLRAICNELLANGKCVHAQPRRCGKDSHISPANSCYTAPKSPLHVSRKILPPYRSEYCFSKPSAAVCLFCGGGERKKFSRHPGFSRQPAITRWLLSMAQRERANRLTVRGESFSILLTECPGRGLDWSSSGGRTCARALNFLEHVIAYGRFVLLGVLLHFGFPSDFYQELIQHSVS